ncbi:DUF4214 domain-containing protein [Pseudomonas putida]|uniref:DUF4214 domain-containing protein n=1 Tax=Pseudomonas putida TaxID=303 RepID=UPI00349EB26F
MPLSRDLAISAITYLGNNLSLEHDNPDFELWHQISGKDPADFYLEYFSTAEGVGVSTDRAYDETVEMIYLRALTWGDVLPGEYKLPLFEEQRLAFNNASPRDVIKYLYPSADLQTVNTLIGAITSGKIEASSLSKINGLAHIASEAPSASAMIDLAQLYEFGYLPTAEQLHTIFSSAISPEPTLQSGSTALDTLSIKGSSTDFVISKSENKTVVISTDGALQLLLTDVERLKFTDKSVAFDTDGNAGQAYRLYEAAFDRAPDKVGLGFWIDQLDKGSSIDSVAAGFVASQEFQAINGASPSNQQLVTSLYQHILGRAPDQSGLDFWTTQLESGALDKSHLLINFAESNENKIALTGVVEHGIEYFS